MTARSFGLGTLVLLASILGVHALAWAVRPYTFLIDIDSQHYARLASEVVRGTFRLSPHTFNDRFGVTFPTAALYAVLGVGPRTSTLWPLLASLASIVLVFAVTARSFGRAAALLAALLLATNLAQIHYAAHLVPDVVLGTWMFAAAALLERARVRDDETGGASSARSLAVCAGLALVAALVTKKAVLWTAPFLLVVLARDVVRRRHARVWIALITTGLAGLVAYFAFYRVATGDALHPLDNVERTHNLLRSSFAEKTDAQFAQRLTTAPLKFFLLQVGYGHMFALALPALAWVCARSAAAERRRTVAFWGAYVVGMLGYYWFGTTSFHSYNPLPLSPRFPVPLLPPLAILGGVTLASFLPRCEDDVAARWASRGAVAALAVAALVTGFAISMPAAGERALVYGASALALACAAAPAARGTRWAPVALAALVPLGILLQFGFASAIKPVNPLRELEDDFARDHLATLPAGSVVVTDKHSAFLVPILVRRHGGDVRVVDWYDEDALRTVDGEPVYVFAAQSTLSLLAHWEYYEAPDFAMHPPDAWERVAAVPVPETILRAMTLPYEGQELLVLRAPDGFDVSKR